jgi:predicted Fe-Mo cluster-binding NifX family protein
MKIAISATGDTLESLLDQRFGRATHFIFVETETMEYEAVDNAAVSSAGGAGIAAAQMVADKDAVAVITGQVGPNAMNVLKTARLDIYKGQAASVRENVEQYKMGTLEKINTTGPAHFGLGAKG